MFESTVVPVVGPDNLRYTIVLLRPSGAIRPHVGPLVGTAFRRVTARVFDDADEILFDVRATVPQHQVASTQLELLAEAKDRLQRGDWSEDEEYEL
jgi:hypothetical protein